MTNKKNRWKKVLLYLAVIILVIAILAPFSWLVISSLSYRVDLISVPLHWLPEKVNLENYKEIFLGNENGMSSPNKDLPKGLFNSLFIAGTVTLFSLFVGSLAAYAFTRLSFRGKSSLFLLILTPQFISIIVVIIPLYMVIRSLGLLNTRLALIIANCSFTLPLIILLMSSFFSSIPKDLEEAARIDGCSRFGTIFRIILPLSTPGLTASGLFAFIISWNDFFTALILSSTMRSKTISVLISEYSSKVGVDYVAMAAAGVIASLPPVILAIIFQKYIIKGLTAGSIKG